MTYKYEAVIGLEVHAQLLTNSKLWCNCSTDFLAPANSQTCPICLGYPGVLPVLNKKAVELAVKFGLSINAKINLISEFSRKNYFYQDQPNGYQITQYETPIVVDGILHADVGEVGEERYSISARIERAHIENDTGKTIHDDVLTGKTRSFVDFNRAGMPLIEIVTKPDLKSGREAYFFLLQLKQILTVIDVCNGNMEEGSLRCDANVSIRPIGQEKLGTKIEVKNMNSFKNVEKAINFEIERQTAALLAGEKLYQETRMWDASSASTKKMRSKEDAMDYRYFPEPDLLPLVIDNNFVETIKKSMPELPHIKRQRFINDYKIPYDDANVLSSSANLASYYEKLVSLTKEAKLSANWVLTDVLKILNENSIDIKQFTIDEDRLAGMINLISSNVISGKIAKTIFEKMLLSKKAALEIVQEEGLLQISDKSTIIDLCRTIIEKNPVQYQEYNMGKDKLFGFFVGQVLKESKGKANPEMVTEIMLELLKK